MEISFELQSAIDLAVRNALNHATLKPAMPRLEFIQETKKFLEEKHAEYLEQQKKQSDRRKEDEARKDVGRNDGTRYWGLFRKAFSQHVEELNAEHPWVEVKALTRPCSATAIEVSVFLSDFHAQVFLEPTGIKVSRKKPEPEPEPAEGLYKFEIENGKIIGLQDLSGRSLSTDSFCELVMLVAIGESPFFRGGRSPRS